MAVAENGAEKPVSHGARLWRPSFDGWTRQDDAFDLPLLQRTNRHCHGEVSLARAGWPNSKDDVVTADRLDIALLRDTLRGNDSPAGSRQYDVV